ncbi:hypothetical protein J7L49_00285 [Candidatus Bathyarchaeota archaeon]|nr:hypothetical protein [Candidatus Bathyarchaeota archaeon]
MSQQILQACKELIDDAKMGCVDLVFKETCLEILSKAHNILPEKQFKQLVAYAAEKMREKTPFELKRQLMSQS